MRGTFARSGVVLVELLVSGCTAARAPAGRTDPHFSIEIGARPEVGCADRSATYTEMSPPAKLALHTRISCALDVTKHLDQQLDLSRCASTATPSDWDARASALSFALRSSAEWRERETLCETEARRSERTVRVRQRRPGECLSEMSLTCEAVLRPLVERWEAAPAQQASDREAPLSPFVASEYETTVEAYNRLWRALSDPVWRTADVCMHSDPTAAVHLLRVTEQGTSRSFRCAAVPSLEPWRELKGALAALVAPEPEPERTLSASDAGAAASPSSYDPESPHGPSAHARVPTWTPTCTPSTSGK